MEYAKTKFYRVGGKGKREKDSILSPFCFSRTPPPPPPPSQKPLKNHQILWKTCVENDVCRNPQRGSFVWLEKVGSIVGGFSKDNGNGSKNARFFKLCRNYVNWVKMSTDVLLIKPIAFYFWKFSLSSRSMSALINWALRCVSIVSFDLYFLVLLHVQFRGFHSSLHLYFPEFSLYWPIIFLPY